jgi:hypothetical protein
VPGRIFAPRTEIRSRPNRPAGSAANKRSKWQPGLLGCQFAKPSVTHY